MANEERWRELEEASLANDLDTVKTLAEKDPSRWKRNLDLVARLAARMGHVSVLQYAVKKDFSVLEKQDEEGETVGHVAAENGRRNVIAYIADENPFVFVKQNVKRETILYLAVQNNIIKNARTLRFFVEEKGVPLTNLPSLAYMAAVKGKLGILRYLVAKDPDVLTKPWRDHENLAQTGAVHGHPNIVRYVAQRVPSFLTEKDLFNNNIMHMAVQHKSRDIKTLKFLEEKGVPPSELNRYDKDVVYLAAETGNLDVIRHVEEKDPSVLEKKYKDGKTIAHVAAKHGEWQVIRYLAKKKPSLLAVRDDENNTIFHIGAKTNHLNEETLRFLLDEMKLPLQLNGTDKHGRTVAELATYQRNCGVIRYLGERTPELIVDGSIQRRPLLEYFMETGFLDQETLKSLIQNCGPLVESRRNTNGTFLKENGSLDLLQYLMVKSPPSKLDSQALHEAVAEKHLPDVVKYLIEERKIDVNILNERAEPPIFTAVRAQHRYMIQYLAQERNANLTLHNVDGENILYVAIWKDDLQTIKYVLDSRKATIDLEWRNKLDNTVLHTAVDSVVSQKVLSTATIEYFVEQKHVNVNALGHEGKTCLHLAALRKNIKICTYLREHGANPEIRDANGSSYWDYATFNRSRRFRRSFRTPYQFHSVLPSVIHERMDEQRVGAESLRLDGVESSTYDLVHSVSQLQNFLTIGKWIFGRTKDVGGGTLSPKTAVLQNKINAAAENAVDIILQGREWI